MSSAPLRNVMPDFQAIADARGKLYEITTPPHRIVSLVPSITELLADLELEKEVVGITRFCVHPASWRRQKQIVGGTKNAMIRRVQALRPDLILANLEENTKTDVETLDTFAPVYVTDVATLQDAVHMIRAIGLLTGKEDHSEMLAQHIETDFTEAPSKNPLRAAYLIWRKPYMTVGGDTFIHDVMRHGGFTNVFGHLSRYPVIDSERIAAAQPDVLLLSSEPYPFRKKHVAELQQLTGGIPSLLVDGEQFSWYGSRLRGVPAYLDRLYTAAYRICS